MELQAARDDWKSEKFAVRGLLGIHVQVPRVVHSVVISLATS